MSRIAELVRGLAVCRAAIETAQADVARAQERLEETDALKALEQEKEGLAWFKQEASEAEQALREAALAEYRRDGNKHPHPAITVAIGGGPVYKEDDAIEWAGNAMPSLITKTLNRREFEKMARRSPDMFPFDLSIEEVPLVKVARDLSEYIQRAQKHDWRCYGCGWEHLDTDGIYEKCPECGGEVIDVPF